MTASERGAELAREPGRGRAAGGSGPAGAARTGLAVALAAAAGSLNAISFLSLGGVFVSVMTGNLVLLGVGAARGEPGIVAHVAVALAGYGAGVAGGAALAGRPAEGQGTWPARVTVTLLAELALLAGLTAGWELTGGRPEHAAQLVLLAAASVAMGAQSAAVNRLDVPGFSTTFLTSTLIRAVTELVSGPREHLAVQIAAVTSLVAGALASGLLVTRAPRWAPVPVMCVLAAVLAGAAILRRAERPGGRA
jgi:uncharacterized membrane protein YoaK (UPF0700 family)